MKLGDFFLNFYHGVIISFFLKGGQTDAAKFLSWLGLKISPLEDINEIISYDDDDEEIDFKVGWFDNLNKFMPKSGLLIQESKEEGFASIITIWVQSMVFANTGENHRVSNSVFKVTRIIELVNC